MGKQLSPCPIRITPKTPKHIGSGSDHEDPDIQSSSAEAASLEERKECVRLHYRETEIKDSCRKRIIPQSQKLSASGLFEKENLHKMLELHPEDPVVKSDVN